MTLSQLADIVAATPGVSAWYLTEKRLTSHQRYRIFSRTEAARSATARSIQVMVHTEVNRDGKRAQGEAGFTLTGDQAQLTTEQVRRTVERAALVANPPYTLPGPEPVPAPPLCDPAIHEDPWGVIAALEADMDRGGVSTCASEFFADRHEVTCITSEGFSGHYQATELFTEFVVLGEDGHQSVECYGMRRARRADDMDLTATLGRYDAWVRDRLRADLPPTGVMPVVFGEEALDTLFDTFACHAGAKARYEGWSRLTEGRPLIEDCKGDAISLSLDPLKPWHLGSRPFDPEGQVGRTVALVTDGRFIQRAAPKRYADYLGIPATGSGGTLVVRGGTTPYQELLTGGPVLEALRFSTFHPNPVTGAFSGELRTAHLHDGDQVIPICGGSVSGNVWSGFADVRLSAERTVRPGYEGPAGVRLEQVTVAGRG